MGWRAGFGSAERAQVDDVEIDGRLYRWRQQEAGETGLASLALRFAFPGAAHFAPLFDSPFARPVAHPGSVFS
jgi:hypothetical protein